MPGFFWLILAACQPEDAADPLPGGDDTTVTEAPCEPIGTATVTSESPLLVSTAHFELEVRDEAVSRAEAMTLAQLAEAAWPQWVDAFGAEPAWNGPARWVIAPDAASFAAAVAEDGDTAPPGVGGYFSYTSETAYLWVQPTLYYTRVLALHELTHLFHYAVRAETAIDVPFWYGEGVAEHLGRHHFDGACLSIGVEPLVTLEDFPADALQTLGSDAPPISDWVTQDAFPSRPVAMTWWRFLSTDPRWAPAFEAWTQDVDLGISQASDLGEALDLSRAAAEYATWLQEEGQHAMELIFIDWLPETSTRLTGWTPTTALARAQLGQTRLHVEHALPDTDNAKAGIVVGYDSPNDYTAVLVAGSGELFTFDVGPDGAWFNPLGQLEDTTSPLQWDADLDAASVTLNGQALSVSSPFAPTLGLLVNSGETTFTELSLE